MNAVSIIPVGTVTFLFTDLEGSTRSWEQQGRAMSKALARHDAIVRTACSGNNGYVFKTLGDAFCVAFGAAHDALAAAIDLQLGLLAEDWKSMGMATPLSLRLALHTGPVETRDGDYFGPTLNRTSRLLATAHGGQSLLSEVTAMMVREHLLGNMTLKGLGEHRLKDLQRPESVYQLVCPPLPTDFPPLRSLEGRPHNLPLQLTGFVGREQALSGTVARLRERVTRLLTLLGPGGTGKTRMALQVGAEALDDFEDGAFFVPLESCRQPHELLGAIAHGLGLRDESGHDFSESTGRSVREAVDNYLRAKQLLLVLDNFEQLIDAAPLVVELLRGAPGLKVLATSRTRLQVSGEQVVQVVPLTVPDLGQLPTWDRMSQYESVRLFLERGRSANEEFRISDGNAPAIAEICHRLDGLPLALELAAARLGMFTPEALLARLGRGLSATLTGGARDLTARQRTLRGAIAWSYDLLEPTEQALLARISVFTGGFSLEGAEALSGDNPDGVLDGLEHLVNSSLVTQRVGVDAQPRFGMLETIRDFAAEQLGARGEGSSVRLDHLGYSLDLVRRCEFLLEGSDQLRWLDVLEAELGNIRQALAWALDPATVPGDVPSDVLERTDRVTKATQLTVAAEALFSLRGRPAEASGWARQCLRWVDPLAEGVAGPAMGTLPLVLPALLVAHAQRLLASDPLLNRGTRQRLLEASISTCETLGDQVGLVEALMQLVWSGFWSGDSEKLRHAFERAVDIARTVGRPRLLGECLNVLAYQSQKDGHFLRSLAERQEAVAVLTEAGDRLQIGWVYLELSNTYRWSGNDQAGIDYAEKARSYATHLSDPLWWMSRRFLVRIYIGIGKFESAAGLLEECERQSRHFGDPVWISALESFRGDLARGLGDLGLAREHYARVRDIGRDNQSLSMAHLTMMEGHRLIAAQHLCRAIPRAMEISSLYIHVLNEALTCLAPADPVAALRIGGQASAFSAAGRGNPSYTFDQVRADEALVLARSLVSPEICSQAWEAGKLLPIEEVLSEAGVSLASMTDG